MNLIVIYGPPAAGKLTVANELAKLTGYSLVDNHKATDYLVHLFPRSVPEYGIVRSQLGRRIRLLLYEAATQNGVNLITTFAPIAAGHQEFVQDIVDAVEGAGGWVRLVQLLPNVETLEKRVVGESRKGIKAETVERLRELIKEAPAMFEKVFDTNHLAIDNSTMEPREVAQKIVDYYHLT